MHLFIGKPHLDLAKTADTLLTPVFAIGKYNTSVHSSRITAAVKCHLTDRRVLAFLNRQQAWSCEGLHSSGSSRFTASCGPEAKGSASLLVALGRQETSGCLGTCKRLRHLQILLKHSGGLCHFVRRQDVRSFSIYLAALKC